MHWHNPSGMGIVFAFENKGDLKKSSDWEYIHWEEANYPQWNSPIGQLSRINDRYERISVGE